MRWSARFLVMGFALGVGAVLAQGVPSSAAQQSAEQQEREASEKSGLTNFGFLFAIISSFGQQKVTAFKVLTAQIASAGKARVNASMAIAESKVTARSTVLTASSQLDLYRSFSVATGQGPQTCDAVNQRNDVDSIGSNRDVYKFAEAPRSGRLALPVNEYEQRRMEDGLDRYCSADEHNLGLCRSRFDGMASAAVNWNKVTQPDQFTRKQLRAASDYIANLVPPPIAARSANGCDPGCQLARLAALRVDATSSMVAVPLAAQLAGRVGEKTYAEKQ